MSALKYIKATSFPRAACIGEATNLKALAITKPLWSLFPQDNCSIFILFNHIFIVKVIKGHTWIVFGPILYRLKIIPQIKNRANKLWVYFLPQNKAQNVIND